MIFGDPCRLNDRKKGKGKSTAGASGSVPLP